MLGLDNPIHIAFLLVVLLLVFGAKRLPELGKSLGAGLRGFKDSVTGEGTHTTPALADAPHPIVRDPAARAEHADVPPAA